MSFSTLLLSRACSLPRRRAVDRMRRAARVDADDASSGGAVCRPSVDGVQHKLAGSALRDRSLRGYLRVYLSRRHAGRQLSDSNSPYGECVDKAGDVFVADFGGNTGTPAILEYAHGGTKPIATLSDPGYYPESCSIDPTTGNLAVTNDGGPARDLCRCERRPDVLY